MPSAVLTFPSTYQAPDLYEEVDGDFGTFIVVGKSVYVRDDGANTWTVERQEADTALEDAASWLSPLLGRASVERVGSIYRSDIYPVVLNHGGNAYNTFQGIIKTGMRMERSSPRRLRGP